MAYTLNIAKVNKLELSPNENNLYSLLYVIVADSVEYKPAPGSSKSAKPGTLKKNEMINVFEEIDSESEYKVKFTKTVGSGSLKHFILIAAQDNNTFAIQCDYSGEPLEEIEDL